MIFLRDSFCLSAVSLLRQRHDILDFSHCPLSLDLHVTLTNLLKLRFKFHHHLLHLLDDRQINHLLHRADQTQQGRNSCPRLQFLAFSLDSITSLSH